MSGKPVEMSRRFWPKVRKGDGCWEWTASKHPDGYGQFGVGHGRAWAHRVAWELCVGPIPAGMVVMHTCDNPGCVRPDHLRIGTQLDNIADMVAKGRSCVGARNGQSRLTAPDVKRIRELVAGGQSQASVARAYSVSAAAVYLIVHGKNWRHVA